MNDVVCLRLGSSELLMARFIAETSKYITVSWPMVVTQVQIAGEQQGEVLNLKKWFPFDPDQIIDIPKDHIIAITGVSSSYEQYWYNTVAFQMIYVEPQAKNNVSALNRKLEEYNNVANINFAKAIEAYKDSIPTEISTEVH